MKKIMTDVRIISLEVIATSIAEATPTIKKIKIGNYILFYTKSLDIGVVL